MSHTGLWRPIVTARPTPHTESASDSERPTDHLSWLWLAFGLALLPFSTVHAELPLAAWLGPIFLLRFTRTQSVQLGLPTVLLVSGVALAFAWRDTFPFPIGASIGLAYGVAFSLGYAADRVLSPRLTGLARTLVFPLATTTLDWLTSSFGIFATYGSPAYTQASDLAFLQLASLTGIWGLTFLIHWLAPVANEVWEHASAWRVSLGLFATAMLGVLLFGSVRVAFFPPTGPTLRVAALADTRERYRNVEPPFFLLQPGTAAERASFHARAAPLLEELFARTEQQARAGAQVVSWFEDAAIILKEDEPAAIERGRDIARREGIYLQMGLLVLLANDRFPFQQDRAVLIGPHGQVVWTYDKAHPTPGPETAFTEPGSGAVAVADTALGRIASVICFDMDFPWLVRQAGQARADLLIAPSLDWDTVKTSHAQIATVRAVENGVSLLRPTGDGVSQAVDHQGRVLAAADSFPTDKAVFLTSVPGRGVATVYAVIGDSFAYLCSLGLVVLTGMALLRRRVLSAGWTRSRRRVLLGQGRTPQVGHSGPLQAESTPASRSTMLERTTSR
jgi:apolipoprotein N-acyltransferase